MARPKSESLLNAAAGELVQEMFAALKDIRVSLTLTQMMTVMARLEKKCDEIGGNGNGKHQDA
jgi:hypothetical protein